MPRPAQDQRGTNDRRANYRHDKRHDSGIGELHEVVAPYLREPHIEPGRDGEAQGQDHPTGQNGQTCKSKNRCPFHDSGNSRTAAERLPRC